MRYQDVNDIEGKRRFDLSLKQAREDFEEEKMRAIDESLDELRSSAIRNENKIEMKNRKILDGLDRDWRKKCEVSISPVDTIFIRSASNQNGFRYSQSLPRHMRSKKVR